ncbi:box C/D snoRNA protein 1 [Megalops cyprinoides]|uniref:box C/D snoRNA protein 1 n=1 Tax=Megalops cyprinoides TaxID=118141 RepID=UPI001863F86F|nr:box C/D snoRNA protein 1 [Megalops cyprinoides]
MESSVVAENCPDSPDEGKEVNGKKRKISLTNCGTCGTEAARYRCPGCLKHSCSLPCVKKHKTESGCSGVRDKTAFVPVSQFDEMNLLSDYRFLEDTARLADSVHRDPLVLKTQISKHAKILKQKALKCNVLLKLLPPGFSRRRENSTYFNKKEQQFFWHLKLLFPQSSAEYTERRVPDSRTLQQILTPYIHPSESDPVKRQRLKVFTRTPPQHVKVFMKAENRKSNSVRYHELDLKKSLLENLKNKVIIEYPVLHIVLKDHCENYTLLGQEPGAGQGVAVETPLRGGVVGDVSANAKASVKERKEDDDEEDEMEDGEIRDEEEDA